MDTMKNDNLFSLEGKAFVDTLYHTFLFREPDPVGEKGFLNMLAEGRTKEEIALTFLSSPEAQDKYMRVESVRMDPFSAEALISVPDEGIFLRSAYLVLLGRPADSDGLNHFQNGLWNGTLDRTDVILALMRSSEGQQHGIRLLDFEKRQRKRTLRNLVYKIPFFGRLLRFLRSMKFMTAAQSRRLNDLAQRVEQIELREQRIQKLEQQLDEMMKCSESYNESGLSEEEARLYHLLSEGVRR